jgi:hypothetical protein
MWQTLRAVPALVMTGRRDEVTVTRIKVEAIQGRERCEGIRHVMAHAVAGLGEQFIEKTQAALAFEAFEKGGDADLGMMDLGELLDEIATALEDAEASTNPASIQVASSRTAQSRRCFAECRNSKRGLKNFSRMIELQ